MPVIGNAATPTLMAFVNSACECVRYFMANWLSDHNSPRGLGNPVVLSILLSSILGIDVQIAARLAILLRLLTLLAEVIWIIVAIIFRRESRIHLIDNPNGLLNGTKKTIE